MFLLLMVSGWGTVWAAPEKSLDASISQQSAKITKGKWWTTGPPNLW